MKTIYRLHEESDNEQLFDKYDFDEYPSFPTIVADRDGEIVGVLATFDNEDMVIAGPFYADSPMIMIRLGAAYEKMMQMLNVRSYFFYVEKCNPNWHEQMKRFPAMVEHPELEDDELYWFERMVEYPMGVSGYYLENRTVH